MATKNPRLMTMLERALYDRVKRAAKAEGLSLSAKVRDLVREALELEEDAYWAAVGEERLASFDPAQAKTHEEAWAPYRKRGK